MKLIRIPIFTSLSIVVILAIIFSDVTYIPYITSNIKIVLIIISISLIFFLNNFKVIHYLLFFIIFFFIHQNSLKKSYLPIDESFNNLPQAFFVSGDLNINYFNSSQKALLSNVKIIDKLNHKKINTNLEVIFPINYSPDKSSGVIMWGTLKKYQKPINPFFFDLSNYYKRNKIGGTIIIPQGGIKKKYNTINTTTFNILQSIRNWTKKHLLTHYDFVYNYDSRIQKYFGITIAIILGDTSLLDKELLENFRNSGSFHLFAVSGLHVGILMVIIYFLCTKIGLKIKTKYLISFIVVWIYVIITGSSPSSIRAALMATIFILGELLCRKNNILNSMGLAALIVLTFDTHLLFKASFQLTYGVLLTIFAIVIPTYKLIKKKIRPDPFIPNQLLSQKTRFTFSSINRILLIFTVSFSAWIGSSPLIIYHFRKIYPQAVIANTFLAPLAFIIIFLAFFCLVFSVLKLTFLTKLFNLLNLPILAIAAYISTTFSNTDLFKPIEEAIQKTPKQSKVIQKFIKNTQIPYPKIIIIPSNYNQSTSLILTKDNNFTQATMINTGNNTHAENIIKYILKPLKIKPKSIILTRDEVNAISGLETILTYSPTSTVYANSVLSKKINNKTNYSLIGIKASDKKYIDGINHFYTIYPTDELYHLTSQDTTLLVNFFLHHLNDSKDTNKYNKILFAYNTTIKQLVEIENLDQKDYKTKKILETDLLIRSEKNIFFKDHKLENHITKSLIDLFNPEITILSKPKYQNISTSELDKSMNLNGSILIYFKKNKPEIIHANTLQLSNI